MHFIVYIFLSFKYWPVPVSNDDIHKYKDSFEHKHSIATKIGFLFY